MCLLVSNLFLFSGLLTGGVYNDIHLKRKGFPAENVKNGSVIVIKTHGNPLALGIPWNRVILLIRHPYKTLNAEFNRLHSDHLGHANVRLFKSEGKFVYLWKMLY